MEMERELINDIMSLERERQDLLDSLTPRISRWEDTTSTTTTMSRVAGINAENPSPVQKKMDSLQVRDDDKGLENYFDFILQDTEDLGHRMLSMSQFLSNSHASISSYNAEELVSTASRLVKISKDLFYKPAEEAVEEAAEEKWKEGKKDDGEKEIVLSNEFLRLSSNVRERPYLYKNELAMMFTEEDEEEYEREKEAEREAAREREEKRKQWKQKKKKQPMVVAQAPDQQETKSPMERLKEGMDTELRLFAGHREYWQDTNCSKTGRCGRFQDKTTLSPMQFTHYTPGITLPPAAVTGTTVQIYSFKITRLHNDLKWPLYVYGEVAARDTVDRNRNLLFCRSKFYGQVLTENDSSLCLTGPSRAIVAEDHVVFEVKLRIIEGDDEIKDRVLMSLSKRYDGSEQPLCFHGSMCSAELSLGRLAATVQATIVGVCVGKGRWPFECGGRVTCSLYSAEVDDHSCDEVVLLDSAEKIPEDGLDGYISLSRNVVSVQLQGRLKVSIQGIRVYGESDPPVDVHFHPQDCNVCMGSCFVYGTKVDITVAWSRIVRDKMDLLIEGYSYQA
ncbi:hypothetical protein VPH35_041530 [Triticum aestivum]|nr:uncharacterized protein LOC123055372 [Triticum aestivum]